MAISDELLLHLRQIGADDVADGLEDVASNLDKLEKSQDELNATGDESVKANREQKKSLLEVNAALDLAQKGFNVAKMAVGALGDVISGTVDKYADYSREVQLLSNNLGLSTEETSRLIQTADDYGVSIGAVTSALEMMVRRGVQPSVEELAKLADEYKAIDDPVKRAALMTEKLGRGWTTLTPLLKEGGDAIRSAAKNQNDALIITEKDVKITEELRKAKDELGDTFDGLAMRAGKVLTPALTGVFEALSKLFQAVDANSILLDEGKTKTERLTAAEWLLSEAKGFSKPLYEERVKTLKEEIKQLDNGKKVRDELIHSVMNEGDALIWNTAQREAATQAVTQSGQDLIDYISAEEAGMKRASDAAAIHDKFMQNLAISQEAAAKAAGIATVAFLGTATSLNGANKLSDYAKVALAGLQQQLESGQITASQYSAAYQTLGINAGIVSKESLASTRGIEFVNKAFADGLINAEQYSSSVAKIPSAAKDGVVTLKEVGLGSIETVRKTKQDMLDEAGNAAKDTVDKVSGAISTNMLKVSNAVGATKSLVNDLKTDLKTLSDTQIMIKYSFVLVGSTPLSGGGMGGRDSGGSVSPGTPYIIGKPETFVPQQAGVVIPNQNYYDQRVTNITTDQMGVALAMARARQMAAEARM